MAIILAFRLSGAKKKETRDRPSPKFQAAFWETLPSRNPTRKRRGIHLHPRQKMAFGKFKKKMAGPKFQDRPLFPVLVNLTVIGALFAGGVRATLSAETAPETAMALLLFSRVRYSMNGVTSNGIFSRSATAPAGLDFSISSLSLHGSILMRPPSGSATIWSARLRLCSVAEAGRSLRGWR